MTDTITYRLATCEDIPAIDTLQQKYLVSRMPLEQQSQGFVTTPFTHEQLTELIEKEDGMLLAWQGDALVGYMVAASWHYFSQWPIFVHMVSLFPETPYLEDEMTMENSYQYGPVCIDESMRGKGLLQTMFPIMREHMHKRFPYGLTFINQRNARSFAAHTTKLSLDVIREFGFNDQRYHMLGFPTAEAMDGERAA